MRAETRHQLKQDRFSRATIDAAESAAHWSVEHKSKLVVAAVVVLLVAAAAAGAWYYLSQQDQSASVELSQAVRTMNMPVRPPNMPAQPDAPSFASSSERATAAHKQLQDIVDKYPHTHSAEFARYFLGLTAEDLGDKAAAESDLQTVVSSSNSDLAALAKMAMASVYRNIEPQPTGDRTLQATRRQTYQHSRQGDRSIGNGRDLSGGQSAS